MTVKSSNGTSVGMTGVTERGSSPAWPSKSRTLSHSPKQKPPSAMDGGGGLKHRIGLERRRVRVGPPLAVVREHVDQAVRRPDYHAVLIGLDRAARASG